MRRVLLVAVLSALVLVACGGGESQPDPTSIPISAECRDAFAALAPESGEGQATGEPTGDAAVGPASPVPTIPPGSMSDLIPTIQACDSVEEWIAAYRTNPGPIQLSYEPINVLRSLCSHAVSAGIEGAALCEGVATQPEVGPTRMN